MREGVCWALCACAFLLASCRDKCLSCSNHQFGPPLGIVVSAVGAELIFFDLNDHSEEGGGELQGWVTACQVTASGEQLFAADNQATSLAIYEVPSLDITHRLSLGGVPMDLRMHVSGLTAHLITRNGFYYRIALQDLEVDTLEVGLQLRRLRMRPPNDREAWITSMGDSAIRVVREEGFFEREPLFAPSAATDLCFTPDGRYGYAAVPNAGVVWKFNAETSEQVDLLPFGGGPVDVDLSHNGHFLAAADSSSGAVRIWDLGDGLYYDLQCGTRAMRPVFAETFSSLYVVCPAESFVLRIELGEEEPYVADTVFCVPTPYALSLWE